MTALKIGGTVRRLTVRCITLVSCLSVSASSRKVRVVTSSQLLGSVLQCGRDWQLERQKLSFRPLHLSSHRLNPQNPHPDCHRTQRTNKTKLIYLFISLSFSPSPSLSLWSPHRNSVPSILQLSGSLQPCMPLAYLSTKLHNDERVNKGEETDSGEGERWEKERGQGKARGTRQGDGAV